MTTQTSVANNGTKWDAVDPQWAWEPYQPTADAPWNLQRAARLYRRAAFGAPWAELRQALDDGPEATVSRLLAGGPNSDAFAEEMRSTAAALLETGQREDLPAWWLYAMLHTPHPLREKTTLFWHNHFATSAAKVQSMRLMYQQNALLRAHALGEFAALLAGIIRDPAMLIWLDATSNRKSRPNENLAREVMELFCLGRDHYTEQDIKQAARALTGFEVRHNQFRFNDWQHDTGSKLILGQQGNFNGDDLVRVLLEQPAASRFLTAKVVRWLVSDQIAELEPGCPVALIDPLASRWRQQRYDTAWLVGTILRSNLFFSPLAQRCKIKGPVEFAMGLVRALEGNVNGYPLVTDLESLGQAVFYPPNVKGWNGGTEWINSATLIGRANLAWSLASGSDNRYGTVVRLDQLAALDGMDRVEDEVDRLLDILVDGDVPEPVREMILALARGERQNVALRRARIVHAIATLPEYQVS